LAERETNFRDFAGIVQMRNSDATCVAAATAAAAPAALLRGFIASVMGLLHWHGHQLMRRASNLHVRRPNRPAR